MCNATFGDPSVLCVVYSRFKNACFKLIDFLYDVLYVCVNLNDSRC